MGVFFFSLEFYCFEVILVWSLDGTTTDITTFGGTREFSAFLFSFLVFSLRMVRCLARGYFDQLAPYPITRSRLEFGSRRPEMASQGATIARMGVGLRRGWVVWSHVYHVDPQHPGLVHTIL